MRLPALHTSPGHFIRVAQQVHTTLWRREFQGAITTIQYACLMVIDDDPMLDQQSLGARASLDKATTADVVRRMVRSGLIGRAGSVEDRRRRLLTLTRHGRDVLRQQRPAVLRVQTGLLSPLQPPERVELVDLLTRLAGPIETADDIPLAGATTLYTAPGHLIRRAQQRHESIWASTVPSAVTSVQYGVLLCIHGSPLLSQIAVGSMTSLDKSSIADVVARLERRGLISRVPDSLDGRRHLIDLTQEGASVVETLGPDVLKVQALLFEPLSRSERTSFIRLMKQVCHIGG